MKLNLKTAHFLTGIVLLIIFAATGNYMSDFVPNLPDDQGMQRMAWRANHIYILFVGLIHLLLGVYWQKPEGRRLALMQKIGSITLFAAALTLLYAFKVEPAGGDFGRPITTLGLMASLGATLLMAAAVWFDKKESPSAK